MNIIKSGDIFLFRVEAKYGLIQVIEKSKVVGYNIRVFCDLIDEIDDNLIKCNVDNSKFYYLKSFFEYTLVNNSSYMLHYKLPNDIKMPQYMRSSERKLNGDLVWYIIDAKSRKVLKKYDTFHETLRTLSPDNEWGIEYIKKRWLENFTLDSWDDDLENKWYLDYIRKCEPEKLSKTIVKVEKRSPTEIWDVEQRISSNIVLEIKNFLEKFEKVLANQKRDYNEVKNEIGRLIHNLNLLNDKYNFISTKESEEILDYINFLLNLYQYVDINKYVDIDKLREW